MGCKDAATADAQPTATSDAKSTAAGYDAAAALPELSDGTLDNRAKLPAPEPQKYLDFQGNEAVIKVGEDRMVCLHLTYDGPDVAFTLAKSYQGKYGHHVVLLEAKEPLAPNTVVDCSDASEMKKYGPYTITDTDIPPGHATLLKTGMKLVLQSHYVNAGTKPLTVRDGLRLSLIPMDQVTHWTSTFVTNTLDIEIPAKGARKVRFDCAVKQDVSLILVGGHMHEYGKRFELEFGPSVDKLERIYLAAPWTPEFRDLPPIYEFFDAPIKLTKGSILRTTCEWDNPTDKPVTFPHEMCDAFGFVAGTKVPEVCDAKAEILPTGPGGGTARLAFTVSEGAQSNPKLKDPLVGHVYGSIYKKEDVKLTGPVEGATAVVTGIDIQIDLRTDAVSKTFYTSPQIPVGKYTFLGFFDVDGSSSGAADRDPETGDPVTLPTNVIEIQDGKAIDLTISFDLVL